MTYIKPDGIPSYEKAQAAAAKGEPYCWLCASPNLHKVSSNGTRRQFDCKDCHSYVNYTIPDAVYKAIDKRKRKKVRKE